MLEDIHLRLSVARRLATVGTTHSHADSLPPKIHVCRDDAVADSFDLAVAVETAHRHISAVDACRTMRQCLTDFFNGGAAPPVGGEFDSVKETLADVIRAILEQLCVSSQLRDAATVTMQPAMGPGGGRSPTTSTYLTVFQQLWNRAQQSELLMVSKDDTLVAISAAFVAHVAALLRAQDKSPNPIPPYLMLLLGSDVMWVLGNLQHLEENNGDNNKSNDNETRKMVEGAAEAVIEQLVEVALCGIVEDLQCYAMAFRGNRASLVNKFRAIVQQLTATVGLWPTREPWLTRVVCRVVECTFHPVAERLMASETPGVGATATPATLQLIREVRGLIPVDAGRFAMGESLDSFLPTMVTLERTLEQFSN